MTKLEELNSSRYIAVLKMFAPQFFLGPEAGSAVNTEISRQKDSWRL